MNSSTSDQTLAQAQRRKLLKLAGLGMGFGLLPLGLRLEATPSVPEVAAGYWLGGAALEDFSMISRGWGESCALPSAACVTPISDELVSAGRVIGMAGGYRLRLIGAEFDRSVQVEADYGGARHGLWSGWRANAAVGSSALLAIRWHSLRGEALPLVVGEAAGAATVAIPARAGIYVVPLQRRALAWHEMALQAPDAAAPQRRRLRARDGIAPPSYLLVAVEKSAEAQVA